MSVDAFADNSYVGKVLDESGAPLAGAVVKAVKGKDMAVTDVDGVFELPCRHIRCPQGDDFVYRI